MFKDEDKKDEQLLIVIIGVTENDYKIYKLDRFDEKKYKTARLLTAVIKESSKDIFSALLCNSGGDLAVGVEYVDEPSPLNDNKEGDAFNEFRNHVIHTLTRVVNRFELISSIISKSPDNELVFPDEELRIKEWDQKERNLIKAFCLLSSQDEKQSLASYLGPNLWDKFQFVGPELLNEIFKRIASTKRVTGLICDISTKNKTATINPVPRTCKIEFTYDQEVCSEKEILDYYVKEVSVTIELNICRKLCGIAPDKDKYYLKSLEEQKEKQTNLLDVIKPPIKKVDKKPE